MAYKKRKKIRIRQEKDWSFAILFFTPTRNNMFINISDSTGILAWRTSGGHLCYVKDFDRRVKRSKEVLNFLAIKTAFILRKKQILKLAFIFKHKWRFSLLLLKRVLSRGPSGRKGRRRKFKLLFVGRSVSLPFGGCRPGRRRNFKSERKKRYFTKRWNRFRSEILHKGLNSLPIKFNNVN